MQQAGDSERPCQLCGKSGLALFEVPGVVTYLLCRDCRLYQYGPPPDNTIYNRNDYHSVYERESARKLRTATVRLKPKGMTARPAYPT